MKRNFPKYVAPGDLRKDSKRSTSFRALCSTSNPATKQDNATGVVETTTTSWKQPSVTKNAAEKTTTTSWKQPSFMKNVEDIPTTRKGTTITTHKTRQQPFDIEDEDASDSDVPQSPMQTVMEEDHPETNIQSSIQPNMEEDHPETNMEDIYDDPLPQVSDASLQLLILLYDEINKAYESNPDATEFDVVEKVFGPQNHGKAAIFGGGVKVKDIRGTSSSKYSELNAKLQQSEAEKVALQNRLEDADLANERREKEINDLKAADDKRDKEMQELKSMVLSLVARMPQP
ncbi:hypothetical protein LINPERPRIM_LOCUS21188 [Linum perenne]